MQKFFSKLTIMIVEFINKATFSVAFCAVVGCLFISCGRTDNKPSDIDTTQYALATEEGPGFDEARTLPATEVDFNGKHYVINVSIAPCDSLPLVKDSYGDPFMDNAVKLQVSADDNIIIDRSFVKNDFAAATSGLSLNRLVLGGLAFNVVNSNGLSFSAQLNEPGDIEGGYVFKVTIPLMGGQPVIVRETVIDDLGSSYVD